MFLHLGGTKCSVIETSGAGCIFFHMWCLLGGSSFSFRLQVDEHLNNIFESDQPQEINPQNVIL